MLDPVAMGLKLYPRGFLGAAQPIRLAVKPKPYEIKIRSPRVVGIVQPQAGTADANTVIETLYSQYVKRSVDTQSFEFREKVLIAALNAFGAKNFYTWYQAQLQSPAAGEMHLRFLSDCLRFLRMMPREMTLETWAHLLKCHDESERPLQPCETAKRYFGLENRTQPLNPQQYNLIDTIQRWCEQPQGLEDLLGTLHLLFGNL